MCTHCSSSGWGHGESDTNGESEGYGRSYMTGMSPSKSISLGTPIESFSLWPSYKTSASTRVHHAAEALEKEIRDLARRMPVADFVKVRIRVEDLFDSILLSGLR
jgi:hypothetical protein